MRRMYSEEQLKKLIEEYGMTEEEVEAIVGEATTGKFVKIIPAPSSTTLTEEQYNDIINGVFIEGTDMNYKNPVMFPLNDSSSVNRGLMISGQEIACYAINKSTRVIVLVGDDSRIWSLRSVANFNGKNIPAYPSNTGTFVLKCDNGSLKWVEEVQQSE